MEVHGVCFIANNKLYWYGSKYYADPNGTRNMQKAAIWEMDTAENFTETTKHVPVEFGNWCYREKQWIWKWHDAGAKILWSVPVLQLFSFQFTRVSIFPYIDPTAKTVEWIKAQWKPIRKKTGKAGLQSWKTENSTWWIKTCDLFVCTIGVWAWTKLDNRFTRLGNRTPYSYHGMLGFMDVLQMPIVRELLHGKESEDFYG